MVSGVVLWAPDTGGGLVRRLVRNPAGHGSGRPVGDRKEVRSVNPRDVDVGLGQPPTHGLPANGVTVTKQNTRAGYEGAQFSEI
jgi:hypothetical protein